MNRRVVVTGLGPVTSVGIGKREFFTNLCAGRSLVKPLPAEFEKNYQFHSRFFVPFPEFNLDDYCRTKFDLIMEGTSQLAAAATSLALKDAELTDVSAATIILGVGIASMKTAFRSHLAHTQESPGGRFNRMVIPMMMTNAPAAWVSILFGVKGPACTINASCASGTVAIGEAAERVARGSCDVALAGGVECLHDPSGSIMRGFDALNALTTAPDGLPRPFSTNRSGFLFSEGGGCVLVLEELERARRRQAPIYAEVAGYESNSDAHSIFQMEESGATITNMLQKLIGSRSIDYFNAHGTGTIGNDETESGVIRRLFGSRERQPLINSTKGFLGHTIGASGAIEAAVTALSLKESRVHGNLVDEPMPDLNLVQETMPAKIRTAISASYGFGGHNAGLLFQGLDES